MVYIPLIDDTTYHHGLNKGYEIAKNVPNKIKLLNAYYKAEDYYFYKKGLSKTQREYAFGVYNFLAEVKQRGSVKEAEWLLTLNRVGTFYRK